MQAWADADIARAIALLAGVVKEHPRDLAALKLAQYLLFNLGDAPGMLRIALVGVLAAWVPMLRRCSSGSCCQASQRA